MHKAVAKIEMSAAAEGSMEWGEEKEGYMQ